MFEGNKAIKFIHDGPKLKLLFKKQYNAYIACFLIVECFKLRLVQTNVCQISTLTTLNSSSINSHGTANELFI